MPRGSDCILVLARRPFPQYNGRTISDLRKLSDSVNFLFTFVNPFFEELLVRAFLITEIEAIFANTNLAATMSIVLQTTYHLYQGIRSALALSSSFTLFTLYYVRKRRILPVIPPPRSLGSEQLDAVIPAHIPQVRLICAPLSTDSLPNVDTAACTLYSVIETRRRHYDALMP